MMTARISGRATLEHEPRDGVIELEMLLPSHESFTKVAGLVNDMTLALSGRISTKSPRLKLQVYVDRSHFQNLVGWIQKIADHAGGETTRTFKGVPGEAPPADEGDPPQA